MTQKVTIDGVNYDLPRTNDEQWGETTTDYLVALANKINEFDALNGTGALGATGLQGSTGSPGIIGQQGTQGSTGLGGAGIQGPTGVRGLDGIQGQQGGTGIKGDQGVTGPYGLTGARGYTGATGDQGFTGLRGPTGSQGQTGVKGATGLIGPSGLQGVTGADGQLGLQGAVGQTGAQGHTGVGVTGPSGGQQGETGLMGATGTLGIDGVTGPQGATGLDVGPNYIGATGVQGIQGNTGTQGVQGLQGDTGTQGLQGNTGTQGVQGNQGDTGVQGNTGVQGQTGVQGNTGVQGETGVQGDTGLDGVGTQGPIGSTGIGGSQGVTGAGIQGVTGLNGADGADGTDGVTGVAGSNGASGATGIQGITGAGAGSTYWNRSGANLFPVTASDGVTGIGYLTVPGIITTNQNIQVNGNVKGVNFDSLTAAAGKRMWGFDAVADHRFRLLSYNDDKSLSYTAMTFRKRDHATSYFITEVDMVAETDFSFGTASSGSIFQFQTGAENFACNADLTVGTDSFVVDSTNDVVSVATATTDTSQVMTVQTGTRVAGIGLVASGATNYNLIYFKHTNGTNTNRQWAIGQWITSSDFIIRNYNTGVQALEVDYVNSEVRIAKDLKVDTDTLVVDSTNDRVGINKASPTYSLDVLGTVNITNATSLDTRFYSNADSFFVDANGGGSQNLFYIDADAADGNLVFSRIGSSKWVLNNQSGGNFAIVNAGTTQDSISINSANDNVTFYNDIFCQTVTGTVGVSSGGTYNNLISGTYRNLQVKNDGQFGYVSSSQRFKKDIRAMSDTSWINLLNPVNFVYKQDEENRKEYGLIAEQVASIPEADELLIIRDEEGQPESVSYEKLIPVLLNEMQKLRNELEELKKPKKAGHGYL